MLIAVKYWLTIALILFLPACKRTKERDGFNLKLIEFELASNRLIYAHGSDLLTGKLPIKARIDGQGCLGKISYAEHSSKNDPKKSFDLSYRFTPLLEWKEVRLSAQAMDRTALKALMGFDLFTKAAIATPYIEPTALYSNDDYLGLYFWIDRVDEKFFATHNISAATIYKTKYATTDFFPKMATNLDAVLAIDKGNASFSDIRYLIEVLASPTTTPADIEKVLDVKNYMLYVAISVTIDQWDWLTSNFFIYRDALDNRFHFIPRDFEGVSENMAIRREKISLFGPTTALSDKIFSDPGYRAAYLSILQDILTGIGSRVALGKMLDEHSKRIAVAFSRDNYLSGDGHTINDKVSALKTSLTLLHERLLSEIAEENEKAIKL